MKKHLLSILSGMILIIGMGIMLYPVISDYWNSLHQSRAIAAYAGNVQEIEDKEYQEIWEEAEAYNKTLRNNGGARRLSEKDLALYQSILNPGEDGIMGYIEIPSINVYLPIYHGTEDAVLQIAVGHVEWSSLPVGGAGSHCVLSGHRGLPSARLFSDLDQVKTGDQIILKVMDAKLIYQVNQIVTVEPDEIDELMIEEGKDLCTLITCTPYGINTHRLLVRGERIDMPMEVENIRVSADAVMIQFPIKWPVIMVCGLMVIYGFIVVIQIKQRDRIQ